MSVTLRALAYGNHRLDFTRPASFAEDVRVLHGYECFPRRAGPLNAEDENGGTYANLMSDGDLRSIAASRLAAIFPFNPTITTPILIDMEHWRLGEDADVVEWTAFRQWVNCVWGFVRMQNPMPFMCVDGETLGKNDPYPMWLYPPSQDLGAIVRKYMRETGTDYTTVVTGWVGGTPTEVLSDDAFNLTMLIAKVRGGEVWVWCQCDTPEQAAMSQAVCERVERWCKENANA